MEKLKDSISRLRTVDKWILDQWILVQFFDLRKGDIFRMFEDEARTEPVKDKEGNIVSVATSDPYKDYSNSVVGVYTIECDPYIGGLHDRVFN
jgi:hypothetical protein